MYTVFSLSVAETRLPSPLPVWSAWATSSRSAWFSMEEASAFVS